MSDRKSKGISLLLSNVKRDSTKISCGLSIGSLSSRQQSLDSNYASLPSINKCEMATQTLSKWRKEVPIVNEIPLP